MRSSMRLSVWASWLTSSLRLVVGTLAVRSEWPILEAASVISRTWLNMRRVAEEHNAEPEQHNQQPQQEEAYAQASQHPQFIPLREAKIDVAAIVRCEGRPHEKARRIRGRARRSDGPGGISVARIAFKCSWPLPAPTHSLREPSIPD